MSDRILLPQDEDSFLKSAANLFTELAAEAIESRGFFSVALAGGSTPKKFYALLAESYHRNRVNWPKIHMFWGDERMVPPNHPDSNYKMVQDLLISRVPIPSSQIYRIPGEMEEAVQAARTYEQTMRVFFRAAALEKPAGQILTATVTGDMFPRFDFVLLGVGEDGHTASLFPGSSILTEKTRWVSGGFISNVSSQRVTLTFPVINNAREILFLCSGEAKASVIKEIFQNGTESRRFPAQMVRPSVGRVTWLIDKGAASKIPPSVRYSSEHV